MHKLKIGDLVCYNGAGMKHKTLGIVMDFDFRARPSLVKPYTSGYILIMWSVVGKYMPRTSMHAVRPQDISSGQLVWHEFGKWIERAE